MGTFSMYNIFYDDFPIPCTLYNPQLIFFVKKSFFKDVVAANHSFLFLLSIEFSSYLRCDWLLEQAVEYPESETFVIVNSVVSLLWSASGLEKKKKK